MKTGDKVRNKETRHVRYVVAVERIPGVSGSAVLLNRETGGFRWWNTADLTLLKEGKRTTHGH